MTDKMRVPEGSLCDQCHDPKKPLTEANSQHLFQRDWDGNEITYSNVHRECADPWAKAYGGTIIQDEPLPPRPPRV
jgi:hypothetical protein